MDWPSQDLTCAGNLKFAYWSSLESHSEDPFLHRGECHSTGHVAVDSCFSVSKVTNMLQHVLCSKKKRVTAAWWPKPSCKAQWKGEEDKADKGRGGKTTSGNGQAWSSASPRGQWRTGKNWRKLVAKSSVVPQRPSRLRDWWCWWWWWSQTTTDNADCVRDPKTRQWCGERMS